jgi:predicted nucleic acid-binding protein
MTLIDTNVVIDVVTRDPSWYTWTRAKLIERAEAGPLRINPITFAELAVRNKKESDVDLILSDLDLRLEQIPKSALFLAGRAFSAIAQRADRGPAFCPTFSSGRMRRPKAGLFSRGMSRATGHTSRRCS